MKELEYKPFTRAELEVNDFGSREYLAFCAVATEQFGKTVSERLAGYNQACMNAEIFALNQRYPQTYKEADKTKQQMMRQVLLEWYDEKRQAIVREQSRAMEQAVGPTLGELAGGE